MDFIFKIFALPLIFCEYVSSSRFASQIRVAHFRIRGAKIGNRVRIQRGVQFRGCKNIIIGDDVFIGDGVRLIAYSEKILIGDSALIASDVIVITRSHLFAEKYVPISSQGYKNSPVFIGSDVWLGFRTVVLAGAAIGNGSIIGANSIVNSSVPNYSIFGGVPAKYIKDR